MLKQRMLALMVVVVAVLVAAFVYYSEKAAHEPATSSIVRAPITMPAKVGNSSSTVPQFSTNFAASNLAGSTSTASTSVLAEAAPVSRSWLAGFPFRLGLDLSGGAHLVYKADVSKIAPQDIKSSMEALRDVIEKRVNILGVSEPNVQVEEGKVLGSSEISHKLVVELPGETDINRAIKQIGATPELDFRLVKADDIKTLNDKNLDPDQYVKALREVVKPTGFTGRMLKRASLQFNPTTGQPSVALEFNDEGRKLFGSITESNIGNYLGIYLDGRNISSPVIRQAIKDGKAEISGSFTIDEAKKLVRDINYGALPVPVELVSTQTVGASLGQAALNQGVLAGIWAFIIIAIFLVVWYRLPGFIAVCALAVYTIFMLALFKLVPVTLTAAGIAGFILSIGMAVDANILIFERMREELVRGRDLWTSMHEGFARAWLSIRDSNTSSIITGVILYYFGSSSIIKGFALVFVIGVLVSMFSAITASRLFLYAVSPTNSKNTSGRFVKFLFSNGFGRRNPFNGEDSAIGAGDSGSNIRQNNLKK